MKPWFRECGCEMFLNLFPVTDCLTVFFKILRIITVIQKNSLYWFAMTHGEIGNTLHISLLFSDEHHNKTP